MANWPASLPNPSYGLQRRPVKNTIRTNMDAGPAKVRRKSTKTTQNVRLQLELTDEQMTTLEDFVVITLKDVLTFDWTDHVTGRTVKYRFVERPAFTRRGYNDVVADCELEILP